MKKAIYIRPPYRIVSGQSDEWRLRKWVWALLVVVLGTGAYGGTVLATMPFGVMTDMIGRGRFDDIDVTAMTDIDSGARTDFWQARIDTKGVSDLHVLQNTIQPGGTFGWHSHPGPSLVIVKSGTATLYFGDDPTCTPLVVQAGSGFIDEGSDVHVVRNEGTVDLVTVVVSLVPTGFMRRIDEPAPVGCLPEG
jgi:quercetin dioxygenase-like cupin family protein